MTCEHKRSMGIISSYSPSSPLSRLLCYTVLTILILAGIIALILYLVYHPSKPHFVVSGVAVYQLTNTNTTSPVTSTAITASLQFTLLSRNPNRRSSILYDRLSSYVTYKNQAITQPAPLPVLFLEKQGEVAMSPVMGGSAPLPVSADVAAGLMGDEAYGVVGLRLVVIGRMRYKSGPFRSGWYSIYVRCDVLIALRKGCSGQVPLLGAPECAVDV
ncbi:hypothetical protein J5N97_029346 [Dioscorea zingiberensis]|uniref:Late embryogenesis abundant protein LEA-2 subgroup domain-containing protein n=1 Tax=Dioscorea zingiberensis TaxID=325984 RepID=A0A9D5C193_9LILI|nr:hypothetical protein J5N97_029346 [Dioscorea zingiberensis]